MLKIQRIPPGEIEIESFRRIDAIVGETGLPPADWSILRRMIHTSGDPSIRDSFRIHPKAVEAGVTALLSGRTVVTDTKMVLAGISTGRLDRLHARPVCLIDDPEVANIARLTGVTRAACAMGHAIPHLEGGIVAIGNAPTALLRLLELMEEGRIRPALVIGVPVGFVNAEESKDLLSRQKCPFVTLLGTRGGSAMAASIVNALAVIAIEKLDRGQNG